MGHSSQVIRFESRWLISRFDSWFSSWSRSLISVFARYFTRQVLQNIHFSFKSKLFFFCLMKIKGKTFPLWKWIFREKTLNFERSATSGHATAKETNLRVKSLDCVNNVRGYFYFLIFIIQKGKTSFLGSFFRLRAQRENLGTHRAHNAACR